MVVYPSFMTFRKLRRHYKFKFAFRVNSNIMFGYPKAPFHCRFPNSSMVHLWFDLASFAFIPRLSPDSKHGF